MLMPASQEFISLCQAQMMLVGEALNADSTAIYLADNWHEDTALPDLVPIAAYPASVVSSQTEQAAFSSTPWTLPSRNLTISPDTSPGENAGSNALQVFSSRDRHHPLPSNTSYPGSDDKLIIPLTHEGVVIGVLTSQRAGQPWQEIERHQWDRLAQTLTLACIIDQRGQWLENRLQHNLAANRQQSQRFHELLHQIRSPLTAIKTFGKLLLKRLDPESYYTGLVRSMVREGDRIQDLLQYLDSTLQATDQQLGTSQAPLPLLAPVSQASPANLASADQGHKKLQTLTVLGRNLQNITCNLSKLLLPMLESSQVLAESHQLDLDVEILQGTAIVTADPKAVIEIVATLLENAFKYAGNHESVWVQVGLQQILQGKHFHGILVGDTGPGIPISDQPHIFNRHYRGMQQSGKISGTGLGLSIVQDLTHAMNGYIELFSPLNISPWPMPSTLLNQAQGGGTVFIIWLPQLVHLN